MNAKQHGTATKHTMTDADSAADGAAASDDESVALQVRITLTLAPDCADRSLQVPVRDVLAVPAATGRRGLSAVINHLLNRGTGGPEDIDDDDKNNDDGTDSDNGDSRRSLLPAIAFDCFIQGSPRLLRTGIEREARRSGRSLEVAVPVVYFPAPQAPESSGESEPLPDWIAALSFAPDCNLVCAGCYDGSIVVFDAQSDGPGPNVALHPVATKSLAHAGPIHCLSTAADNSEVVWMATGAMDHTLQLHQIDTTTRRVAHYANCAGGHASAVSSVDLLLGTAKLLASGDWDGGVCLWNCAQAPTAATARPVVKKARTDAPTAAMTAAADAMPQVAPQISIRAHSSKVSGVSWGNHEKLHSSSSPSSSPRHLITGSWDHTLKVWDVERQDCLLTLNGSRVVTCLDTSYHSAGIVATGHPDCTVRLWDTRTGETAKETSAAAASSLLVADTTLRPSHKAWISAVQWNRDSPYQLASTSHDGTVKLWDIRSPLPLHTVRAFPEKGLALCYGSSESGCIFAGGNDCVVKQFRCAPATEKLQ